MQPFKVLCIGGSDSSAGAGIQADLKAVSACGCYALNVVTAVTAQDTFGVQGIWEVNREFVAKQMEVVLNDIGADAVKTGMLLTAGNVWVVGGGIREENVEKNGVGAVILGKRGGDVLLAGGRRGLF